MARYTAQRYIDAMRHRLGKTPSSRHDLVDTFNEAGRALYSLAEGPPYYHPWSWTHRANETLLIPANTSRVELPRGFGTIISIQQDERVTGGVEITDLQYLQILRAERVTTPLVLHIAFNAGQDAANPQESARRIAEIYPEQGNVRTDIRITYTVEWEDVDGDVLEVVPNIPQDYDRLLRNLAEQYAVERENNGIADTERTIVEQELARLVAKDSSLQPSVGHPTHSVMNRARAPRGHNRPHREIRTTP